MFAALEDRLFIPHLEEDEVLSRIVHKHWLIGLKNLVLPIFVLVLSMVGVGAQPGKIMTYIVLGVFGCSVVWTARNFLDYYLDAWIITDQGIIDIAWHGWFHRESTRVLYSDIQGVSYEIQGVWATILGYGTLAVEKISTGATVELPYVKRPKKVELLILKNMEAYLQSKNLKDATHVQDVLSKIVSDHLQLKSVTEKRATQKPE